MENKRVKWRATIFWPQINQQIENMVKKCNTCQQHQRKQQREPMKPSNVAQCQFVMVGSDLLNWNGQDFVLVVDYYSRFWDIKKLYKTDSAAVIKKLKHIFSRMGIPEAMRSDNGPQYSSSSFKKFSKNRRFQHVTSSHEYPRSNVVLEPNRYFLHNLKFAYAWNFFDELHSADPPDCRTNECHFVSLGHFLKMRQIQDGGFFRGVL